MLTMPSPPSIDSLPPHKRVIVERMGKAGHDLKSLSVALGKNVSYMHTYVSKGVPRKLDGDIRLKLAKLLEIPEAALNPQRFTSTKLVEVAGIETIRGREYAILPSYSITASAGDGAFAEDGEPDDFQIMPSNWLKSVTRARLSDLCVIQVAGDSMWETLHNGDNVLVDRSRKTVGRPGIYVLQIDGELIVKRVQKHLQTGHIEVISDNPRYPTMTITEEERLAVVGRVVWMGRALG
jgi:phage repressor protein C with HTH and peptisase S24 domain